MEARATRLARLFTASYASRINSQLVYPAAHVIVKPDELASALTRPVQTATYEPHQSAEYLAATLAYGIIQGHPFLDGNKRTAFFLAHQYLKAQGLPGLTDEVRIRGVFKDLPDLADRFIGVAASQIDLQEFAASIEMTESKE